VTDLDRRGLLKAACAGCAALGLAACGRGSSKSTSTAASSAASAPPTTSTAIVKLADIPVGGSVAARSPSGQKLLLSRPTPTAVAAFSATCTHQQCVVEPDGAKLSCPCHGSSYDAFTGKVLGGPAPAALHPFAVKVSGEDVVPA
jgi:Rieske Fe-S protein